MSYKTILVYLENTEQADTVLPVACRVAEQHRAHLIGLYVVPLMPAYVATDVPFPAVLEDHHSKYHRDLSEALRSRFVELTKNQSFVSEWRSAETTSYSVASTVAELAHTSDLVVLGQVDRDASGGVMDSQFERLVVESCRPILLVPSAGKSAAESGTIGKNVLIAWDGGTESTRAVFDALPVLQQAEAVRIHRVNPSGYERHHTLGTPSELVNTLSRHRIDATLSFSDCLPSDLSSEILQTATEDGADLLVMGAFGHTHFRDYFFAGVTRKLLEQVTVPVLMSHG